MRYPLKNWQKIKRGYEFGEKTFYSTFHLGTDYIVPEGTPVYAPMSCEIVEAGNFPEGGNTVHARLKSQKYGSLIMRLMHLSQMSPPGKYKAGAILGRTGNTGSLTRGPHLHLDLSRKSIGPKNPSNFINSEIFFSRIPAPKVRKSPKE